MLYQSFTQTFYEPESTVHADNEWKRRYKTTSYSVLVMDIIQIKYSTHQ
jgi:hypothetical protein